MYVQFGSLPCSVVMEPLPLAPPSLAKGLGKQGRRERANFFPAVLVLCTPLGLAGSDGVDLYAAMWVTGARKMNLSEHQRHKDLWCKFIAEEGGRAKKSRLTFGSASSAANLEADTFVLWECSDACFFEPTICVSRDKFKGNQVQPIQKLPAAIASLLVDKPCLRKSPTAVAPVQASFPRQWGHHSATYLFKVPRFSDCTFITPIYMCSALKLEPAAAPVLPERETVDPFARPSKFESREDYASRGPNWGDPRKQRSPMQEILFGQLSFLLPNADHASEVMTLCNRIICGSAQSQQVHEALPVPPIPDYKCMRRILIKLDLCLMLSRRVFHSPVELARRNMVSRYLSSDASPQAKHNFFCTIEEVLVQSLPFVIEDADLFDPLKTGLEIERRSLPALTLGRGQASVAHKARLLIHGACLEYGSASLPLWRRQVVSFLSDQGVERLLADFPVNLEGNLATFCSNFSKEPSAGSADDPKLFPLACSMPGLLHIFFNALEEVIVALPEWKLMEQELSAATQLVAEPSSQALILEKMLGDASADEKAALLQFKSKLLSWRWESLQMVSQQWLETFPVLKQKWRPNIFSDTNTKMVERVSAALDSPWHLLFLRWIAAFSLAVGQEASWIEGCFCHGEVLAEQRNRWQRKKILREQGVHGESCPWQGRRLPAFALGHLETLRQRVNNSGSSGLTAALLQADPEQARRLVQIDSLCKQGFCRLMCQKLACFQSIPYLFAGGFGAYCGFSLLDAKQAVGKVIKEYESLQPRQRDALSSSLMEDQAVTGQLRSFAFDVSKPLHEYPDAFLRVRSLAFVLCAERRTEGEHAMVKFSSMRGFRFAGPVVIAARKRRLEVRELIVARMQWLSEMWHSRKLFTSLLEHVLPPADVFRLTFAQRCKRVYARDRQDHFADMEQWEKEASLVQKTTQDATPKAVHQDLCEESRQLVYFFKSMLANGTFASISNSLWQKAANGILPCKPAAIPPLELHDALTTAEAVGEDELRSQLLFQVVEAHPESKVTVKLRQQQKHSGLIHVSYFPHGQWVGVKKVQISMPTLQHRILDVSCWTDLESFQEFCSTTTVWDCQCSQLVVRMEPLMSATALPLCLPDFLCDEDPLEKLLDDGALALHDEGEKETVFETGDRPVSIPEQRTIQSLFSKKAFSRASGVSPWDLDYFNTQALDTLTESGLIFKESDLFGDTCVWLTDACKLSPGLELTNPRPILLSGSPIAGNGRLSGKVQIFLSLLQDGWELADPGSELSWFRKDHAKVLVFNIWRRPEAYFRALSLSDLLFEREGNLKKIHHHGPATYYTDMMKAGNLAPFAKMTEQNIFDYNSKRNKSTNVESKPRAIAHAEPLVIPEEDLQVEPVACKEPQYADAHVLYDRYTHQSGQLRCFIQCTWHKNCRKYTFVRNHSSKKEAAAWLFAWNAAGKSHKDAELHKTAAPSAQAVKNFLRAQEVG